MLFSRSAEYAVRALAALGELPEGRHRMAKLIAEEEGLPPFFLAKTLQGLARQGLLRSSKGPTGGFRLNRPAGKIRLLDVIEAVDGPGNLRDGLSYLPGFKPIRASILGYLKTTTIADLASARAKARGRSGGGKARQSRDAGRR